MEKFATLYRKYKIMRNYHICLRYEAILRRRFRDKYWFSSLFEKCNIPYLITFIENDEKVLQRFKFIIFKNNIINIKQHIDNTDIINIKPIRGCRIFKSKELFSKCIYDGTF